MKEQPSELSVEGRSQSYEGEPTDMIDTGFNDQSDDWLDEPVEVDSPGGRISGERRSATMAYANDDVEPLELALGPDAPVAREQLDRLDGEGIAERDLPEIGKTVANSLTQERWSERPSERQSMLREALRTVCDGYGLRRLPDLQFGDESSFTPSTGVITLHQHLLSGDSPSRAIVHLAHEARHCYQHDVVAGNVDGDVRPDLRDVWDGAIKSYPKIDEYEDVDQFMSDYWNNPIERDARLTSERVAEGFLSSKRFSLGDLFLTDQPRMVQNMPPVPSPPELGGS